MTPYTHGGDVLSARARAFCSFTVETSFMALVICSVLCILSFLRLIALMVAMLSPLSFNGNLS